MKIKNNFIYYNIEIFYLILFIIKIRFLPIIFGDWGLGIGDWAQSPIPNPQSPIPNPQSPINKYSNNEAIFR